MYLLRLAALAVAAAGAAAVDPVPQLNPLSYVGRWYQMYSDLASSLIESRFCVTADYGVFPNITVSVRNEERTNSPTGPFKQILGYATFTPNQPGELSVYLQGVPVPAPYWVVGLGPANPSNGNLYDYAIVSDPFEAFLFVLARNITQFNAVYNASVYTELLNMASPPTPGRTPRSRDPLADRRPPRTATARSPCAGLRYASKLPGADHPRWMRLLPASLSPHAAPRRV